MVEILGVTWYERGANFSVHELCPYVIKTEDLTLPGGRFVLRRTPCHPQEQDTPALCLADGKLVL